MSKPKPKPKRHRIGRVHLARRGQWWYAEYTTPAGRIRESLKLTSLEQATKAATQIDHMLERGEHVDLSSRRAHRLSTFRELVEHFHRDYKGWSPSTKKVSVWTAGTLLKEWGDLPLSAITARLISGYLSRRIDAGELSNATSNRYLSFLRRLFAEGERWGYLGHNPAAKVPFLKEASTIPAALTEEQLDALLAALPRRVARVALMAADTGMRKGELFSLTWGDIRWDEGEVIVRQSKNNSFRVIPLTSRARDTLAQMRAELGSKALIDLRIFPYSDLKKSLHNGGVKAGIGHVHPHMLRHTFATRLRDRGVPLDRIMELLGQRSMQMVLRYAKMRPAQLVEAIDALNRDRPAKSDRR